MDSVRKEIEDELKRTRLDKTRLYSILLKIVDNSGMGGSRGSPGPAGPAGPAGPPGPAGPAGQCKCESVPVTKAPAKKAPAKKKVTTTSVV